MSETLLPSPIDESRHRIGLARNMIAVHGPGAARVGRENARAAAVAGETAKAQDWLRTLGVIQRMARCNPRSWLADERTTHAQA